MSGAAAAKGPRTADGHTLLQALLGLLSLETVYYLLTLAINAIDFLLGLKTHVPLAPLIKSVEVGGPPPEGEGRPRRSPLMVERDLEANALRKGATMPELLEYVVDRYRFRIAFSWRPVVQTKTVGKGKMMTTITVLGRPQQLTFREFHEKVTQCAAGLLALGLRPGDVVAFWEDTCIEWLLVAHAAWHAGLSITTVYANLGENALEFAVRQTGARAVFTHARHVPGILAMAEVPTLTVVLYRDRLEAAPSVPAVPVLSVSELEGKGRRHPASGHRSPAPNDVACIMYTSGTTGDPKGVILTHKNLMAASLGMLDRIGLGEDMRSQPALLCLPLAHIYSLVVFHAVFIGGGLCAISAPTQLSDTLTQPHGDLREYRPVIFVGVPRVFEVFKKTIESKLAQRPPVVRALFRAALEARRRALSRGRDTPLWNRLVFRPMRQIFGGHLSVVYSGGAPLNPKTQEFMCVVLGISLEQGYGLTETTACLAVQMLNDFSLGNVGTVHDACEVKLVDIPEMGYTTADRPCPRGEILARGPVVAGGYLQLPDLTAEVFRPGGWFATGDVGAWLPDGALQIIDRKKNLVKLAMGEYVALEKLESVYVNVRFVLPNGICCIAHPDKMFLIALILVNRDAVLYLARQHRWGDDVGALLAHPELRRAVQEALDKEAESVHLKPFEQIARFRLYDDTWTPENGMLTAAMKLQRRRIEEHYAADIDALYA